MFSPQTLFDGFDPDMFVKDPAYCAVEVGRIRSWALVGASDRSKFKNAIVQALSTLGPQMFVQNMDTFLARLNHRRDEFARMLTLEYDDVWKANNIQTEMGAILGQQKTVATLAATGQATTPYLSQTAGWRRGAPSAYTSNRLVQPESANPYEPSAVYARASQALEPSRPTYTYMTVPGKDKIPDTEAGPNPRSAKLDNSLFSGPAKLDSSLFSMDFLTEPTLKAKPTQRFEPKPKPPAEPDTVAIEALISQAKNEAVREFKDSMVAPGAGLMGNITGRFMKIKAILEENYHVWTEVTGQFAMDQDQDTTMAALLTRFKEMCCEIMNENHEVAIAAQELVNTVTGAAGVQGDSHVISSDPENDQNVKEVDGGSITDDDEDDQPILDTLKGKPEVTDKPKDQSKGASLDKKASALSVAKVIRKPKPVNRKPGPAKPKPAPAKPKDGTAKPSTAKPSTDPAKPDPAKPPTDDMKLEATGAGMEW